MAITQLMGNDVNLRCGFSLWREITETHVGEKVLIFLSSLMAAIR